MKMLDRLHLLPKRYSPSYQLAQQKRQMERELRQQGHSKAEATRLVADHFSGGRHESAS
jgi:hypothetical protein